MGVDHSAEGARLGPIGFLAVLAGFGMNPASGSMEASVQTLSYAGSKFLAHATSTVCPCHATSHYARLCLRRCFRRWYERVSHTAHCVLREVRAALDVPSRLADLSMPKDLHDGDHVHAQLIQDRARRVTAAVVEAAVVDTGLGEQLLELLPVGPGIERPPVRPREYGTVFRPPVARGLAQRFLPFFVRDQVRDERGGIGTELRLFFVLGRVKTRPPSFRSGQALACRVHVLGHGAGQPRL